MAKKIIIDGYIGPFGYSKSYIRYLLSDAKKDEEIIVELSSLGGSLDHALNIHKQFSDHGNVTVRMNGFNASSATIIALGAKRVEMAENSFYLIHKVMGWVDEFGYKNADDLDALIKKLEKEKKENEKIDVVIAKMYLDRSTKELEAIIDLMKQNTWIDANEALDWGFVDEVFKVTDKVNYLDDMKLVAMIDDAGYPSPKRQTTNLNSKQMTTENSKKDEKSIIAGLKDQVNKLLSLINGTSQEEPEKKDDKSDTDPSIEDRVNSLSEKVDQILAKLNSDTDPKKDKKEEKKDETTAAKKDEKKEEKTADANPELKKELEELKSQLANLNISPAQDADTAQDSDKGNSKSDDLQSSISRAREFRDAYGL